MQHATYNHELHIIPKDEEKDDDMEEELSKNEVILAATAMAQFSQNTLGILKTFKFVTFFLLSYIGTKKKYFLQSYVKFNENIDA